MKDDKFIGEKAGKLIECEPMIGVAAPDHYRKLGFKGTLPGTFIGYKAGYYATVSGCVLIGPYSYSDFDECIVIGTARPTGPRQLVIGNSEVSVSRQLTDAEFHELREVFLEISKFMSGVQHANS